MTDALLRLAGSVAVVTGAARMRGIGRAVAVRLAQQGADVVVTALPRDPATFPSHEKAAQWRGIDSVVDEVRAMGRRALAVYCDVTQSGQVSGMIAAAVRDLGDVHILINNAGAPSGSIEILDLSDELWAHTIAVNLTGTYLMSKCAARAMIDAGHGGAIVNVSSMAGRVGMPNQGAYCAAKFGVIGLTQQMALELAPRRIRVNCVCPGSTETDMMDGTMARLAERTGVSVSQVVDRIKSSIPLGRQGVPADQAAAIAFLVSADAAFITGQTLNVDGGARMD